MIYMLKAGGNGDVAQARRGERRTELQHKSEDRVREWNRNGEKLANYGKKYI